MINYILGLILLILLTILIYKKKQLIEGKFKMPKPPSPPKPPKIPDPPKMPKLPNLPNMRMPPLPKPPEINITICAPRRQNDGEDDWCRRKSKQIEKMTNTRNNLNNDIVNLEETQRQQNGHIKTIVSYIQNLRYKADIIGKKTQQVNIEIESANKLNSSLFEHQKYVKNNLIKKSKEGVFKDISITNIYA